jgi:hypothetical protein
MKRKPENKKGVHQATLRVARWTPLSVGMAAMTLPKLFLEPKTGNCGHTWAALVELETTLSPIGSEGRRPSGSHSSDQPAVGRSMKVTTQNRCQNPIKRLRCSSKKSEIIDFIETSFRRSRAPSSAPKTRQTRVAVPPRSSLVHGGLPRTKTNGSSRISCSLGRIAYGFLILSIP